MSKVVLTTGSLCLLYFSSSVRRQGLGRQLLDTTESFCLDHGYSRIVLSTVEILKPALQMYLGYGYTTVKTEPYGDPARRQITVHFLVKELGAES